jgi:hypothetical protein
MGSVLYIDTGRDGQEERDDAEEIPGETSLGFLAKEPQDFPDPQV